MINEKEFLLNELIEHTTDCDCARSQHFFDERVYKKKAKRFNKIKSIFFLLTIGSYVLIVSDLSFVTYLKPIGIVLALGSTILEVMSYMLNYEEEAENHWKAAQIYADIYRECQFFYSNYYNASSDVWREKLEDISEELSRVSLLSPSLSIESYKDWEISGYKKKYPAHKALREMKVNNISDVINMIKNELERYRIEIYLFGSYFNSMHFNDVDIAVIIHEDQVNLLELETKMNRIEKEYAIMGLALDISVITEQDIICNRFTPFIKNIVGGQCYYKSAGIDKCLSEYSGVLNNYSEMVDYFAEKADKAKEVDYEAFILNAFYVYYHGLTVILSRFDINWYGEKSLITECEMIESDSTKLKELGVDREEYVLLLEHARLFLDKKNRASTPVKLQKDYINQIQEYYDKDKQTIYSIFKDNKA